MSKSVINTVLAQLRAIGPQSVGTLLERWDEAYHKEVYDSVFQLHSSGEAEIEVDATTRRVMVRARTYYERKIR